MANYNVISKSKKIVANIAALTETELAAVRNYMALGYTLEEKKEKKAPKEAFTAAAIQAWLKGNATPKQQEEYQKLFDAPVYEKDADGNKTNEVKKLKDGTVKKQGHVACISWFKETFPEYPSAEDEAAAKAANKAAEEKKKADKEAAKKAKKEKK